jgi:hypothetical protein
MGQLIEVDFQQNNTAYSVEFHDVVNHVKRETVWAANLYHVQAIAVSKFSLYPETTAIMIYPGTAEDRRVGDIALAVMLEEDVRQYLNRQAGTC